MLEEMFSEKSNNAVKQILCKQLEIGIYYLIHTKHTLLYAGCLYGSCTTFEHLISATVIS